MLKYILFLRLLNVNNICVTFKLLPGSEAETVGSSGDAKHSKPFMSLTYKLSCLHSFALPLAEESVKSDAPGLREEDLIINWKPTSKPA